MHVKDALSHPALFKLFNIAIGAEGSRKTCVEQFIRPAPGTTILDMGCGMGELARYMPENIDYYGIDISKEYIETAKASAKPNMKFVCGNALTHDYPAAFFDKTFIFGVLHHLNDEACKELMRRLQYFTKPGGYFVSIEPCYAPDQSPVAKWLMGNDRGEYVRNREGYESIIGSVFAIEEVQVRHDLLRIPYTHMATIARNTKS